MGKHRILLKPKGAATGTAPKKTPEPSGGANKLLTHVVAPLAVAISAWYATGSGNASGKGSLAPVVYKDMPPYEEEHGDIAAMVGWIESNGGSIDPRVTIQTNAEHGGRAVHFYGAAMTRTERERVNFFEIPDTLMLSAKHSMLDPKSNFGRTVKDDDLIEALLEETDQFQLAVTVMAETNYPDSFWRPYLNTLPTSDTGSPFLWNEGQLYELQSSQIFASIKQNVDYVKERLPKIEAIAEKYPDLFPDNDNLESDLTYFITLTSSKSFPYPDLTDSNKVFNAFTPFADLVYHRFGATPTATINEIYKENKKVSLKEDSDNDNDEEEGDIPSDNDSDEKEKEEEEELPSDLFVTLNTLSPKKLVHGAELLISYRAASTSYFFEKYGIVDSDYENSTKGDYINLKLPGMDWPVHDDGTFDFETAQFTTKHATKHEPTTEEIRIEVQDVLDTLPTTLEEDKALLSGTPDPEVPRNALLIRIRFKQVLRNMVQFLEAGATAPTATFEINYRGISECLLELDLSQMFYSPSDEETSSIPITEEVEE